MKRIERITCTYVVRMQTQEIEHAGFTPALKYRVEGQSLPDLKQV